MLTGQSVSLLVDMQVVSIFPGGVDQDRYVPGTSCKAFKYAANL